MAAFIIASFLIGYYLGQPKQETTNVVVTKKKKKSDKVIEEESDPIAIMLENIDNYNGTALGQKDVPEDDEVLQMDLDELEKTKTWELYEKSLEYLQRQD